MPLTNRSRRVGLRKTNTLAKPTRSRYNEGEGTSIELGPWTTSGLALFFFLVGGALTSNWIQQHHECLASVGIVAETTTDTSSLRKPLTVGGLPVPEHNSETTKKEEVVSVAAASSSSSPPKTTDPPKFPASCTEEQNTIVQKQLPSAGCYQQGYGQSCSFAQATAFQVPCHDPIALRQQLSTETAVKGTTFRSLYIDYANPNDSSILDLLRLGSHQADLPMTWEKASCTFSPMTNLGGGDSTRPAEATVIQPVISKELQNQLDKATAGDKVSVKFIGGGIPIMKRKERTTIFSWQHQKPFKIPVFWNSKPTIEDPSAGKVSKNSLTNSARTMIWSATCMERHRIYGV